MRVQWRVATALAAVAAAATISVGMVSYRATDARLLEEVDRSLIRALGALETTIVEARDEQAVEVFVVQTIGPTGRITRQLGQPADRTRPRRREGRAPGRSPELRHDRAAGERCPAPQLRRDRRRHPGRSITGGERPRPGGSAAADDLGRGAGDRRGGGRRVADRTHRHGAVEAPDAGGDGRRAVWPARRRGPHRRP